MESIVNIGAHKVINFLTMLHAMKRNHMINNICLDYVVHLEKLFQYL